MIHRIGPWKFDWAGGRLADVFHESKPGHALDCIDTGGYDFATGENTATREDFIAACEEWVGEDARYYENELAYL